MAFNIFREVISVAEVTYPVFSGANWWKLRNKFKSAFPKEAITEEYLASVLGMQIASVKNNGILSNLRALGLLDDENKCTDLANRWRLDDTYAAACEEMRNHVYPPELIDIGTDRGAVTSWFMNKSGAGKSQAGKLTALYLLVSIPEIKEPTTKTKTTPKAPIDKQPKAVKVTEKPSEPEPKSEIKVGNSCSIPTPSMNINLQIHISAEASPEQIDQIFASMAKHLYGRE